MAENTEVIVLEIDATDAIKELAVMEQELISLKEAQKEFQKGSEEYQVMGSAIRIVSKEQSDLKRSLDASVKARKEEIDTLKFANNSIQQNRELLKTLTAQYIALKNPTSAQTNQIKALSDALKVQEKAIGDTRRSVGNYTESFKTALGSLGSLPGVAGQVASGVQGMNAAFTAGLGPIGLISTALSFLLPLLTQNAEIADQFGFIMDAFAGGFRAAVDNIVAMGRALTSLDFGKFTKLLGGFFGEVKAGASAAYEASQALDELVVANARVTAQISQNKIEVEGLTKSLKDRTKTEKERIAIANKIADIEIKSTELTRKLAADTLAAETLKVKGRQLSSEEQAKFIQLEQDVKNAAFEADVARSQRQTRINILLEKQMQSTTKVVVDEVKIQVESFESAQKRFDAIVKEQENSRKLFADEIGKIAKENQDAIKSRTDATISDLERFEGKREMQLELMTEFNASQAELDKEFLAGNYENYKAFYDAKKALKDKELADSVKKAEEEKNIEQAVFESAKSLTNSLAQIGNVMMGNSAAGLAFQKVLAGVQIGIDTARAISSVIAAATAAGAFAGPAAIIATVANIATGIASVVTSIAKATQILSGANTPEAPQLATFAEGGEFVPVGGKSHAEGGTKFRGSDGSGFEAERGEGIFIMKKSAMSNIGALSNHNMAYGGRSWFGGQTKYAEDGGLVFDGGLSSRAITDANNSTATLLNAFRNLPPAQVSVVEINRVSSNRVEAVDSVSI
jgi:hypothetical protein